MEFRENDDSFLPLFVAKNLVDPELFIAKPWNWIPNDTFDNVDKKLRRKTMLRPECDWLAYSGIRAQVPTARVSNDNPGVAIRAIVIDYDSRTDPEEAERIIKESLPPELRPNLMEISLSDKLRLVWCLERELLFMSSAHQQEIICVFKRKLKLDTLLAGYDENSEKPSEMWTAGKEWYFLDKAEPLSNAIIAGIQMTSGKKASLYNHSDVPLADISAELEARFPGRWEGEFKLDAVGVRFWDSEADNPTGCQVKPDGMLCFTGTVPFMSWDQIFGKVWCDEKRVLKLGNAAKGMYTDGKTYFEVVNGLQVDSTKDAIITRLKSAQLSDKVEKGQTQSEVGELLNYIQTANRVLGAAPLINYPPGVIEIDNERILNLSTLKPVMPIAPPRSFKEDAPFLYWFFLEHKVVGEGTNHLLYWIRRGSQNYRFFEREIGQAVFLCGPVLSGKTLLSIRIIAPIFGGKIADPMKCLMGETNFTDDQFAAGLLAVNDSDYPKNEGLRLKVLQGYKDYVVNPKRVYHPKFQKKIMVESVSRLFTTLNDSAGSAGQLPEVNDETRDKFMFFRAKAAPRGSFPSKKVLEAKLAKELPYFVWWLDNEWQCPEEILLPEGERTGCESYYDPHILELSQTQTYSSNLAEILEIWIKLFECFQEGSEGSWVGTPTALLSDIQSCTELAPIVKNWDQQKVARNLMGLSKVKGSGVTLAGKKTGRFFKIEPATIHES
jgi:hypothetical protein